MYVIYRVNLKYKPDLLIITNRFSKKRSLSNPQDVARQFFEIPYVSRVLIKETPSAILSRLPTPGQSISDDAAQLVECRDARRFTISPGVRPFTLTETSVCQCCGSRHWTLIRVNIVGCVSRIAIGKAKHCCSDAAALLFIRRGNRLESLHNSSPS